MPSEYQKIPSFYKRNERGRFLLGQWSEPWLGELVENRWVFTEKVDGTNLRVMLSADGQVRFGGRTDKSQISTGVLRMLEDPDLRHHCTSEAYTFVTRNFAVPAMAKAYYQIYLELTRASMQKNIE